MVDSGCSPTQDDLKAWGESFDKLMQSTSKSQGQLLVNNS